VTRFLCPTDCGLLRIKERVFGSDPRTSIRARGVDNLAARLSRIAKRNRFAFWVVSRFFPELSKRGREWVLAGPDQPFGMLHTPSSFRFQNGPPG
jgi:hypothetical protein